MREKKRKMITEEKREIRFFIPSLGILSVVMRRMLENVGHVWIGGRSVSGKITSNNPCGPMAVVMEEVRGAVQEGAELIVFLGDAGPCRYGKIVQHMQKELRQKGISSEILLVEKPGGDWGILLQRLDRLCHGHWGAFLKKIPVALYFLYHWEKTENQVWDAVATAAHHGDRYAGQRVKKLWKEYQRLVEQETDLGTAVEILREMRERMTLFLRKRKPAGKAGIRGSLYAMEGGGEICRVRQILAEQGVRSRRMVPLWRRFLQVGRGELGWLQRLRPWREVIRMYPFLCRPAAGETERLDLDTLCKERV